ncbi:MAG: HEAT repeat domain-containing protein [Acidobacteria bacterium]|nr:HEAT repeat domain-containing protein [Acidobacteriota bacterium]
MFRFIFTAALLAATVRVFGQQSPPAAENKAGAGACQNCHPDIFKKWSDSIHGKMIQPASPEIVKSTPFGPPGQEGSRYWREGKFYIVEDGVEREVLYTLGNRRMQHYLSPYQGGQITVLHSTWDVRRREWFHSSEIVPGAPKNFVQQWNQTCLYCHVTQQVQDVKGFDPKTITYKTAWIESSASCERCHGPAAEHVRMGGGYSPSIQNDPFEKLMTCGQCHWAKVVLETGYTTQKSYLDYYSPSLVNWDAHNTVDPDWWSDGRAKRFSNEAKAFFLSGCFQSGKATCMSCHDPHWNRTDGNEALMKKSDQFCRNCHAGYEKQSHTHHAAESSGSSCVNCHMPYSVSGVRDQMRDHSFLPPEPVNTVRFGIPNACTDCHKDQTANWAAEKANDWYSSRKITMQSRALAFTMAKRRSPQAVPQLVKLTSDKSENPLIRASAAGFLVLFPSQTSMVTLANLTYDAEPMVRLEAARALGEVGDGSVLATVVRLTADRYRAVRVHAAQALVKLAIANKSSRLDPARLPSFSKALDEYRRSLEIEADYPHISVQLGALELYAGRLKEARDAYRVALKRDAQHAPAYFGLGVVDVAEGKTEDAVRNVRRAIELSGDESYKAFLKRLSEGQ